MTPPAPPTPPLPPPPTSPPSLDAVLALECQVWEALRAGNAQADAALLHPDFLGVYDTGFAGRDAHAAQLNAGPIVADYALHEARLMVLQPDLVMLAYRADFSRPGDASAGAAGMGTATQRMFVSSLWRYASDRGAWLNVFSQDTPVG
jgi:hypothetical protein